MMSCVRMEVGDLWLCRGVASLDELTSFATRRSVAVCVVMCFRDAYLERRPALGSC
jgi:hypothetical protein